MGTPEPVLPLDEIKRRFENGTLAYPHAIEELQRRGLTEPEAEGQLGEWEMWYPEEELGAPG